MQTRWCYCTQKYIGALKKSRHRRVGIVVKVLRFAEIRVPLVSKQSERKQIGVYRPKQLRTLVGVEQGAMINVVHISASG